MDCRNEAKYLNLNSLNDTWISFPFPFIWRVNHDSYGTGQEGGRKDRTAFSSAFSPNNYYRYLLNADSPHGNLIQWCIALYDKASYIIQLQDLKLDIKYAPEAMWSGFEENRFHCKKDPYGFRFKPSIEFFSHFSKTFCLSKFLPKTNLQC